MKRPKCADYSNIKVLCRNGWWGQGKLYHSQAVRSTVSDVWKYSVLAIYKRIIITTKQLFDILQCEVAALTYGTQENVDKCQGRTLPVD